MVAFPNQTNLNVGFLPVDGTPVTRINSLELNRIENNSYRFDLTGSANINLSLNNISRGDDADLYLYRDSNGNGLLDTTDTELARSVFGGNQNDSISVQTNSGGTYFARVEYWDGGTNNLINYNLDLSATPINGTSVNDVLFGTQGNDSLSGFAGDDVITGGGFTNARRTNSGDDTLNGGFGADVLIGADGDDSLIGGDGNDILNGGLGDDTAQGGNGADLLAGGAWGTTPGVNDMGQDSLLGGGGNDTIIGFGGNDSLFGDGGDDAMNGATGDDLLFGGAGNDFLNGGRFTDLVTVPTGNDTLNGEAGNDLLVGRDGEDRLTGGAGTDTLNGGIGADRFVFNFAAEGVDIIEDFNFAEGDRIEINATGFGGIINTNNFNFDAGTGTLSFGAEQIAILQPGSDFSLANSLILS